MLRELDQAGSRQLAYRSEELGAWGSGLLTFLLRIAEAAQRGTVAEDRSGRPEGVRGMLRLAEAVPEKAGATRSETDPLPLTRIGLTTIEASKDVLATLTFIGQTTLALGRFLLGRASYRRADFWIAARFARKACTAAFVSGRRFSMPSYGMPLAFSSSGNICLRAMWRWMMRTNSWPPHAPTSVDTGHSSRGSR